MRFGPGSVLVVVGSLRGTDRVTSAVGRREDARLLGCRVCNRLECSTRAIE